MKFFTVILVMVLCAPKAFSEALKSCGPFKMNLEGDEEHMRLGRSLYRELYEELEELSLETDKIDVCSFACKPLNESSVQCDMHLRLEYSYIPFLGEISAVAYCQESYSFDGLSDYETLSEECDLSEFPTVLE